MVEPGKKILHVDGLGIPKTEGSQNTDLIMPARFLKKITFKGMGEYVFYDERFPDGVENKNHPFNNPRYKGAKILVAGEDFGCGSSRQHAVEGLKRRGIEGILAVSSAEIFKGNCKNLGVVCVDILPEAVEIIAQSIVKYPDTRIVIDLKDMKVSYCGDGSAVYDCKMPEGMRQALMDGTWDALSVLQRNADKTEETRRRLPYITF